MKLSAVHRVPGWVVVAVQAARVHPQPMEPHRMHDRSPAGSGPVVVGAFSEVAAWRR